MAERTSASRARHDTHASSAAKKRRKRVRTQQHRTARALESSPVVEPDAQEESSAGDSVEREVWDVRESERDSMFDRTSNELGDVERADESDHSRDDSDIERAH
jgi:hypothetical protein